MIDLTEDEIDFLMTAFEIKKRDAIFVFGLSSIGPRINATIAILSEKGLLRIYHDRIFNNYNDRKLNGPVFETKKYCALADNFPMDVQEYIQHDLQR